MLKMKRSPRRLCDMHLTNLKYKYWYIILVHVVAMVTDCHAFNLDIRTATVQRGDPGSMFGYSVAQHKDGSQNWVLVGAPKTQTSQPGVDKAGAVFRCKVDIEDCQQVPFDVTGNDAPWTGNDFRQIEEKSNQMFGASVYSSGNDGVMVACAPNYMYFTEERNRREPVGACYVSSAYTTKFTQVSPCKKVLREADKQQARYGRLPESSTPYGYKSQGSCQSGFSTILTSDAARLVTGAVGSYFWQGQVFSQNLENSQDMLQTAEQTDNDAYDYSYMGYSMTTGHFNGDLIEDYAVSGPRKNLTGRVTVLSDLLQTIATLDGLQMGEYFGYSITAADFNGDGLDDIAVGAPFYTDYSSQGFETGRVHVFFQISQGEFSPRRIFLTGSSQSRSRFGLSVSHVSDINKDGYYDLAVGSPYDGEDGRGAVYLYHGSRDGIHKTPSQIVYARDVTADLATFGYSMSGGQDQDDNLYPDLLIGAYESEMSVTLKSRPIITVNADLKLEPSSVILDDKMCDMPDNSLVSCFTVKTCLEYDGIRTPAEITMQLEWRLDNLKNYTQRAFVLTQPWSDVTRVYRINLIKRKLSCHSFIAYIKPQIRDKLTPIVVELRYRLVEPRNPPLDEPTAMLDVDKSLPVSAQAIIKKNCGPDNICIPDLSVTAFSHVEKYILGTTANINIRTRIRNRGEGSYESLLHILLPPGVSYVNIDNIKADVSVLCKAENASSDGTDVVCDIGNPLAADSTVNFNLKTTVHVLNDSSDVLTYTLTVNSSNPEASDDVRDNIARVNIPVTAEAKLRLTGVSNPEQVLFNSTTVPEIVKESDIGPKVIHLYEVRNIGTSTIETVAVSINWPALYASSDYDLMYLPNMPKVTRGYGSCSVPHVNYKNLTVIDTDAHLDFEMYASLEEVSTGEQRTRYKRSLFKKAFVEEEEFIHKVECGENYQECSVILCSVGPLQPDESALIQVTSRVWIKTIIELQSSYRGLIVTSDAIAKATKLPYNIETRYDYTDTFQVETYVAALYLRPTEAPVPWWVVAVSIVVGCLVLLLLVLLLRKLGFFKRRKGYDNIPTHTGTVQKNNDTPTPRSSSPQPAYKYDTIPTEDL